MHKSKTHKGIKKRMRVTAGGKVRYKRRNLRHGLSNKSGNHLRGLRRPALLSGETAKRIKMALGV